ncbi:hypothetical protein KIN20_021563 [Parelaphostrongylus tenuis]|uniref:ATP-dependent helicase C-terminal domain-containing protein n=1 Tax=Parelaphostrongylus tenuis TaxID=148309 RepID=A0AAD5MUA7_PARTN|nr:hypothetical protein KIN20_021563 [Parelaphostrongylus tenuis]
MDGIEKETANMTIENRTQDLKCITTLAQLLDDVVKWFRDSTSKLLEKSGKNVEKRSRTVDHGYLEVSLKRFHLLPDNNRYEKAQSALSALSSNYEEERADRTPKNKISSAALVCVEKWLYFVGYFKDEQKRSMYKMNVTSEKVFQMNQRRSFRMEASHFDQTQTAELENIDDSQFTDVDELWISSAPGRPHNNGPVNPGFRTSISFWCMGPELSFTDAFASCRSVILASGTLCPIETLKTELGVKFHSQMEGDQVIPMEQIFASVLPVGPSGHKLCATFRNLGDGNSEFISELALVIRSISMAVPKGILCFFPSYRMLAMVYEYMERASILRQISFGRW